MKVPLQDKIAELERRIIRLEDALNARGTTVIERQFDAVARKHWRDIWKSFDALVGRVFR